MTDRVIEPVAGVVLLVPATDATTLSGALQKGNCRAEFESVTSTREASGITTVTVTGATTGVIPPEMLPWEGKKTAARHTHFHAESLKIALKLAC